MRNTSRIGKRPPQYSLLLNPYVEERVSKCPTCKRPTHPRKFALFIHIDGWGPLALGKTCPFCTPCQMVVVHQSDLEAQLAHSMAKLAPEVIGNDYLVIGTLDKKAWQQGMQEGGVIGEMLEHLADFKTTYDLHVEPGGWRPANEA